MALAARMQKKQWHIQPADSQAGMLAEQLQISPVLAQILINRQINCPVKAQSFLSPKLVDLIEPEKMPGMAVAVERVKQALEKKEKIALYGDYDVDGITGVAILWQVLTFFGASVEYYIPHRVDEGYGLNDEAVRQLADSGVNVMITIDCGITANPQAALAGELGIDLIITDHHRIQAPLPPAVAIVHPGMDDYPNPDSAGAMVAFKLAWAIVNKLKPPGPTSTELREFLLNATTLAAMGTIADVVDLRGENRILTNYGLKGLGESKLCGVRALIESAGLAGQNLDSYHIGFRLAPMLNAAGRMGHARLAVELLTSDSEVRCMRIVEYLKEQNRLRQKTERKIFKQACEMITQAGLDHPDRKSIILGSEDWHSGVVGIVASRVIDKFYRPTILINIKNGVGRGSGRSISGFDMHSALSACSKQLVSFGGHEMAVGLKIPADKVDDFAGQFEDYARQNLTEETLVSRLEIDAVCQIGCFNNRIIEQLRLLEPFGNGNARPVFATKGARLISPPKRVGVKGEHLQLAITDNTGSVRCIGFRMGRLEKKLLEADFFNVAYEPQINTYNGSSNIQFVLADIQFE